MAETPLITVYSAPGCHLCEEALATLRAMQAEFDFDLAEVDITADDGSTVRTSSGFPWFSWTARSSVNTSSRRRSCASV